MAVKGIWNLNAGSVAKIDVFQVEGFEELNAKLKQLPDRVKRKEVLAIQRRLAEPIRKAYAANLPESSGTLGRSVAVKSVSIRKSGGNPAIQVVPGKRGKNDGYYKFMVIRKGDSPGSTDRGSRKGMNTVVTASRNRTLAQVGDNVAKDAEGTVAKYVQKKIDSLSI